MGRLIFAVPVIVIDWSMTFSLRGEAHIQRVRSFDPSFSKKCHWPVNDIFLMDIVSLAYGQMSLTSVNDKKTYGHCHWPRSMTLKSVIDHGQWHFLVSLTVSILYEDRIDTVNDIFLCHWPRSMTLLLTWLMDICHWLSGQWRLSISSQRGMSIRRTSLTGQWHFPEGGPLFRV